MKLVKCDRCGKLVTVAPYNGDVFWSAAIFVRDNESGLMDDHSAYDLCCDCTRKLIKWIGGKDDE